MAGFATGHPSAVTSFVIGGAAALTAKGTNFDPTTLAAKEIAVIGVEGNGTYTKIGDGEGANYSEVIIAYKDNNGELHFTPKIPNSAQVRFNQYKAATEQVSYAGFNGTSGSISAADDTIFQIKAVVRTTIVSSIDGSSHPTYEGFYKSDATATQEEIANGLYVSFRGATSKKRNAHYFDVERVAATGSDVALNVAVVDLTFTKDSKVVTSTGDIDAGTTEALAVGKYIRVGTTGADALYKITAVDATNNRLVLDAPFVGDTVTLLDTAVVSITAANAASLDWGIKVSAVEQPWSLDRKNYEQISFTLLGGTMDVTNDTAANKGSGTYKEVAQLEYFHVTSDGSRDHIKEPPNEFPRNLLADSTLTPAGYDLCTISWDSDSVSGIGKGALRKAVIMAIPTDRTEALYGAAAGDSINNVLEEFFTEITSIDTNGALVTTTDNKLNGTVI